MQSDVTRVQNKIQKNKTKAVSFNEAAGRVNMKIQEMKTLENTNVDDNSVDRG